MALNITFDNKDKHIIKITAQLTIICLALLFISFRPFYIINVDGKSMEPTYRNKSLVLVSRFYRDINKKDIILLRNRKEYIIKRVANTESETILIDKSARERPFMPIYIAPSMSPEYVWNCLSKLNGYSLSYYKIPAKSVFVLGDNSMVSEDSRDFGAVALSDMKAKVILP